MSQKNDLTLARVEDLTLGAAAFVPDIPALNRLVSVVASAGGKDKFLAIVQYTLKIFAQFLVWRAQVQHRAGRRAAPTSVAAPALTKFAGIISDARTVHNISGMLVIWRWLKLIESQPYKTRLLRTIERIQGWSILFYFPLEHICYLIGHDVIPAQWSVGHLAGAKLLDEKAQPATINVNVGKLTRASMGLWGVYTTLQLLHYWEDVKELAATKVHLNKTKADATKQKLAELRRKQTIIAGETLAQLCNLPLAVHWGTGSTLIKSELVVNLMNLISNLASFRTLWITNGPPAKTEDSVTDPDILAPAGLEGPIDEL